MLVDRILRFARVSAEDLEVFPAGSLASPRKLYGATMVVEEGVAAVLRRVGVFSRSVREFLDQSVDLISWVRSRKTDDVYYQTR